MAQEMGPGKTIVTILCDHSQRYKSKLFDTSFLKEKDLPQPEWLTSSLSLPKVFTD